MITVFGLGYVGLTTSLYFAKRDKKVIGIDINKEKCRLINEGKLPFKEKKLEKLLQEELNQNFKLSKNNKKSINDSKYIFICVDTSMKEDCSADLSSVIKVIDEILKKIDKEEYRTIIVKSSIPPTTTEKVIIPYIEQRGLKIGKDIGLVVSPEFFREGHSYEEITVPDRIIIGCNDEKTRKEMSNLYKLDPDTLMYQVNYTTAEFSKYLSNSFIANIISFANEMGIMAKEIGDIEIKEAFSILKNDRRWNSCEMREYVHPIGKYGGYCLPKDINALNFISKENGFTSRMLESTISINNELDKHFTNNIIKRVGKNKKIGILGLSFKPDSDDVRETSSYYVIKKLLENQYENIYAYDPLAINNFKNQYQELNIKYLDTYEEIVEKSDVLVVLTIWDKFKDIKKKTTKEIIDFTNKI